MRKMKLNIQLFASGTIDGSSTASNCDCQIIWSSTSNGAVANSSEVTASIQIKKTGSGSTTGTFSGKITIDGTDYSVSKKFSPYTYGSWKTVGSKTVTINHNTDGSKSISISGSLKQTGTTMAGTYTASGTATLDTILRGSELTSFVYHGFPNGSVSYKKYVSSFYDRFTLKSNGITIATIDNPKTSAGTYSDVELAATTAKYLEAATAGNSKTLTITCELKTYNSSSYTTQVGDTQTKTYDVTLIGGTLNEINNLTIANNGTATFKPTITKVYNGTYDNIIVSGTNFSQTFTNVSSGTSYTLNNTDLFNAMGTNTSLTLSFTLKTYSSDGGALLGESTISNKTISLPSYDINASVNSYDDKNKSTQPGSMTNPLSYFKTSDSVMIKNLSSPKITYKVSSSTGYLYGRTINTTGAATKTGLAHNATFDVEPGTNFNSSYSITASDGRQTSSATTQTFTVVPYFLPSVAVKIERTAPTASTATVTVVAQYYNDSGSLLTNKKTISSINTAILTYTEYGGSAVTKSYSQANNVSTSTSDTTTTLTFTYNLTGLDYQKSINATAQFKDLIGYTVQGTDYEPNGLPVINAFRYNDKNYAKVNGDLLVTGNSTMNNLVTFNTPTNSYSGAVIYAGTNHNEASISYMNNANTKGYVLGYGTGGNDGMGIWSHETGQNVFKVNKSGDGEFANSVKTSNYYLSNDNLTSILGNLVGHYSYQADMNNALSPGIYSYYQETLNKPSNNISGFATYGMYFVVKTDTWLYQIAFANWGTPRIATRVSVDNGSTWTSWDNMGDTGWTPLATTSDFESYSWGQLQYRNLNGVVSIVGVLKVLNTTAWNTLVATLPVGSRPPIEYNVVCRTGKWEVIKAYVNNSGEIHTLDMINGTYLNPGDSLELAITYIAGN